MGYGMRMLMGVLLLLPPLASGQQGFPPAQVSVARAEQRTLAPTVELTGSVISRSDSRIAAEVPGRLVWLADIGDAVAEGEVVARIDPRLIDVALRRAQAAVARLESELGFRDRELTRAENLARSDNASATLLDERRNDRDATQLQLADARLALERAQIDLERTELRAPFAGHVIQRLSGPGEYVNIGEDVIRLVDTVRREVVAPLPIGLARYLARGASVAVSTDSGAVTGTLPVRAVVPVGDAVSRMVELRLDAGETDWLVGAPVKVTVPSGPAVSTVAVPRDALVERGGSASIFRVSAENTADQVEAEISTMVGLWVGIAEGIAPGDQVIVRGAERLMPGQAVRVAEDQ